MHSGIESGQDGVMQIPIGQIRLSSLITRCDFIIIFSFMDYERLYNIGMLLSPT